MLLDLVDIDNCKSDPGGIDGGMMRPGSRLAGDRVSGGARKVVVV